MEWGLAKINLLDLELIARYYRSLLVWIIMLVRMGLWRSGGGLEEGKLGEVEEKEKGLRTDRRGWGRGRRGWGVGCGKGEG